MTRKPGILFGLLLFLVAIPAALGQADLVAAKSQGLVGERPDGLVGLVDPAAPPAVLQMIERINAERLDEYRQVASETSAPLAAVQARAGRQIVQALPSGQHFMDAAGRWRKK